MCCINVLYVKLMSIPATFSKRNGNCRFAVSESFVSVDHAFQELWKSCSGFCEICSSLVGFDQDTLLIFEYALRNLVIELQLACATRAYRCIN